jgi:hypothetical protein
MNIHIHAVYMFDIHVAFHVMLHTPITMFCNNNNCLRSRVAFCNVLSIMTQLWPYVMQVTPGTLFVPRWQSTRVSARSLTYTCDITQDSQFQSMTCAVSHVSNWAALVTQSRNLQLSALSVHIMMDANISVPFNFTGAVTTDTDNSTGNAATNIDVYRYVRVASAPSLRGTLVYISLGYIQGEVSNLIHSMMLHRLYHGADGVKVISDRTLRINGRDLSSILAKQND